MDQIREKLDRMTQESIKSKLLRLVYLAKSEEWQFIQGLDQYQKDDHGTYEDWSAKDTLAHIYAWNEWHSQTLRHVVAGTMQETNNDLEAVNRNIFERHRKDSWDRVISMGEKAYKEFLNGIEAIGESDLIQPGSVKWLGDRPLWRRIWGTLFVHSLTHLSYYLEDHGQYDEGLRIQDLMHKETCQIDEEPVNIGTASYNLACYHARAGKREKALLLLADAFSHTSQLKQWATQDTDLASINKDPSFLDLVKEKENN